MVKGDVGDAALGRYRLQEREPSWSQNFVVKMG